MRPREQVIVNGTCACGASLSLTPPCPPARGRSAHQNGCRRLRGYGKAVGGAVGASGVVPFGIPDLAIRERRRPERC